MTGEGLSTSEIRPQASRLTVVRWREAGHGQHDVHAQVAQRHDVICALTPLHTAAASVGLLACAEAASLDGDAAGLAATTAACNRSNAAWPRKLTWRP